MKKILFLVLCLFSISSYAGGYELKEINNTCAPFDGNAINLTFNDSNNSKNKITIMLWRFPNSKFSLGSSNSSKYEGNLNICDNVDKYALCKDTIGTIEFKESINRLRGGQVVEGVLKFNNQTINFKKIIESESTRPQMCG